MSCMLCLTKAGAVATAVVAAALAVLVCVIVYSVVSRRQSRKRRQAENTDENEATKQQAEPPSQETSSTEEAEKPYETSLTEKQEKPQGTSFTEEAEAVRESSPTEEDVREKERTVVAQTAGSVYPAFVQDILRSLPVAARAPFERVVLQNEEGLRVKIKTPLAQYEREEDFLADFFRSGTKLTRRIPIAATETLCARQKKYADTERKQNALRRRMIDAYYSRRKGEDTLLQCEALCKEDVSYRLQTSDVQNASVPPLKRLVLLCVSQKRLDDALHWCDVAVQHGVRDKNGEGYERRREKIARKKEKARK